VTSQGTPYAHFRRSLDTGSVTNALAAAQELKPLPLTDGLELLLLLRVKAPERFAPAALRWHGRFCRETNAVEMDEALAVLSAFRLSPVSLLALRFVSRFFTRATSGVNQRGVAAVEHASRGELC
jgi:hypothetical protein